MCLTSALTLLKSALVSPTKASPPGRESAKSLFLLHVWQLKRGNGAMVFTAFQANKEGVSSVHWHSKQAKPSSTDT